REAKISSKTKLFNRVNNKQNIGGIPVNAKKIFNGDGIVAIIVTIVLVIVAAGLFLIGIDYRTVVAAIIIGIVVLIGCMLAKPRLP
ncbi:MAG: hypothetical protein AAB390_01530, partial [Patescibacteria group bacterium]